MRHKNTRQETPRSFLQFGQKALKRCGAYFESLVWKNKDRYIMEIGEISPVRAEEPGKIWAHKTERFVTRTYRGKSRTSEEKVLANYFWVTESS